VFLVLLGVEWYAYKQAVVIYCILVCAFSVAVADGERMICVCENYFTVCTYSMFKIFAYLHY
jgi:hypothetical protein